MWIDPGQGFGTGNNLSTALTLEMLEQYLLDADTFPESMIDLGIGSGILVIVACHLDVPKVTGVDIETDVVAEVERNRGLNGMSKRMHVQAGQPSLLKIPSPIVISNMFQHELQDLRLDLERLTISGGTLICSGLLGEQEYDLKEFFY